MTSVIQEEILGTIKNQTQQRFHRNFPAMQAKRHSTGMLQNLSSAD
jgi:hypothetical protein